MHCYTLITAISTPTPIIPHPGSAAGVSDALSLLRPLGTLVLKTTVSLAEQQQPAWAALANDIVVNEKQLVGSR